MLNVIMLNAVMLHVVMLSVIMLNVVMLNFMAPETKFSPTFTFSCFANFEIEKGFFAKFIFFFLIPKFLRNLLPHLSYKEVLLTLNCFVYQANATILFLVKISWCVLQLKTFWAWLNINKTSLKIFFVIFLIIFKMLYSQNILIWNII